LGTLLRICKKEGFDPFDMKGSWGGAIGSVQFMPVNLKYAVDGDGDGRVALSEWPDAIMSVANYLKTLGKYDSTNIGRHRALLRYNPSKEYASGVMLLADAIWKRQLNGE
jgi:membrane-bound lytic murein transglycosylase B